MVDYSETDQRAVILCAHVASRSLPILYARRDEPDEPADSGWQFLCYSGVDEDPDKAKVWLVDELLELDPSLAPYMDSPPGTRLFRRNPSEPWEFLD
jgi:hypothetical protein